MPNIQSAIKRMRSDAKKHANNQAALSELKTLSKKLVQSASEPARAKEIAANLISRYDKAVSRGVLPRGRANRRKARVTQFVARLNPPSR